MNSILTDAHEQAYEQAYERIHMLLLDLIGKENKLQPLSDRAIAAWFCSRGLQISLQDVCTYRRRFGIARSGERAERAQARLRRLGPTAKTKARAKEFAKKMKELIANEDPFQPLTDAAMASALGTSYWAARALRNSLGIPAASERRKR